MMFSRDLRDRVADGEITDWIRLWSRAQVKWVAAIGQPASLSRLTPPRSCPSRPSRTTMWPHQVRPTARLFGTGRPNPGRLAMTSSYTEVGFHVV